MVLAARWLVALGGALRARLWAVIGPEMGIEGGLLWLCGLRLCGLRRPDRRGGPAQTRAGCASGLRAFRGGKT